MNWQPCLVPLAAVALTVPVGAQARIYLSVEDAQRTMFGAAPMTAAPVVLTGAQQDQLREASSVSLKFDGRRIWKVDGGGWFVVDEVVGKHETITYAVGIDAAGKVKDIEILEYLESYGYEVADEKWRRQFVGKSADSPLKLGTDIENIGGATLSSKHITDGVKRVMTMYQLALKGRA
jgi:Na+-translocating ferredoxin:NAD+ oxidoreductase RnfG subunit